MALEGILAAVVTPLSADAKSVSLKDIKTQVERMVEAGVHGIVTTGTTGEFPALTKEEHKSVVKEYVDAAAGRIPIIAGVGTNNTSDAIELVQYAEKVGAEACMVVPPFYDPLSYKALYKFFEDVCGSISIPVVYYNLPNATGVHLTAAQLRDLSKIKGFDYAKDTSGNAKELVDLLTNPIEGFSAFNGWDTFTFFSLAHGAKAVVWGVASLVPKECVEFYNTLVKEKNLDKAREQWKFLWEVSDCLESVCYPSGIKAGLEIVNAPAGPVRAPTLRVSPEEYQKLETVLAKRKYK